MFTLVCQAFQGLPDRREPTAALAPSQQACFRWPIINLNCVMEMAARGRFSQHFADFQPTLEPISSQSLANFHPSSCQIFCVQALPSPFPMCLPMQKNEKQPKVGCRMFYKWKVDDWPPYMLINWTCNSGQPYSHTHTHTRLKKPPLEVANVEIDN